MKSLSIVHLSYLSILSYSSYQSACTQLSGALSVLLNREYLPHIGHIGRDVELCTCVEVFLTTRYRRTQALVLHSAMQCSIV